MIHHVEVGTDRENVDQECELSKLHNWQNNLSVTTLKGGQSLILKDNCEILIPKKERDNILNPFKVMGRYIYRDLYLQFMARFSNINLF